MLHQGSHGTGALDIRTPGMCGDLGNGVMGGERTLQGS